jgi:DNA replication protein DnaC
LVILSFQEGHSPGWGKSHLAQALAHEACRQGFDVLFSTTHKMLQHLNGGRADGSFERRLALYVRPDVLILDDFGLRALTPPSPEDMYEIIVSANKSWVNLERPWQSRNDAPHCSGMAITRK